MFHVGQKVVCVFAEYATRAINPPNLIKGNIYTITWLFVHPVNGEACCMLAELPDSGGNWFGYGVDRFRPIVDQRKEVSWTIGADPSSSVWDNRKVKVK